MLMWRRRWSRSPLIIRIGCKVYWKTQNSNVKKQFFIMAQKTKIIIVEVPTSYSWKHAFLNFVSNLIATLDSSEAKELLEFLDTMSPSDPMFEAKDEGDGVIIEHVPDTFTTFPKAAILDKITKELNEPKNLAKLTESVVWDVAQRSKELPYKIRRDRIGFEELSESQMMITFSSRNSVFHQIYLIGRSWKFCFSFFNMFAHIMIFEFPGSWYFDFPCS